MGSTLAFAADTNVPQKGVTDGAPQGNAASDNWTQHSKDGYMTREHAMSFKATDGKPIDWVKLDADADGRISEPEWTAYHGEGTLKSDGSKDFGADERAGGAAGRPGQ
jgi:hypothetical protein